MYSYYYHLELTTTLGNKHKSNFTQPADSLPQSFESIKNVCAEIVTPIAGFKILSIYANGAYIDLEAAAERGDIQIEYFF